MRTSPGRANSTGFWKVMFVLLRAAQQRAKGRRERQSELLTRRAGEESTSWEGFALLGALVLAVLLHGAAAWVVQRAVASGPRIDAERSGKIVVGSRFKDEILRLERAGAGKLTSFNKEFDALCRGEAGNMALSEGASSHDSRKEILETKLRESVMSYGSRDLVAIDTGVSGVPALSGAHSSSA
ncbi:MAG TPA: hypothetical protein VIT21_08325, partial [Chthoniobacterales bacterium]